MRPLEVKAIRQRLGLTQRQLARALGVTETTVARWERGARGVQGLAATSLMLLDTHLGAGRHRPRRKAS